MGTSAVLPSACFLLFVSCVFGEMNFSDLQCYILVSDASEVLPDSMCRGLPNGKYACLRDASTTVLATTNFKALSINVSSEFSRSSLQCASFITKCTSCYGQNQTAQTAPCSMEGNPACTSADVISTNSVFWMGVLSSDTCVQLQNSASSEYSDVQCCAANGCNFRESAIPDIPPAAPPALPGNGPCELPQLSWEEVVARDEISSWSGGLGLLTTPITQVWVCLLESSLPAACGGSNVSSDSNTDSSGSGSPSGSGFFPSNDTWGDGSYATGPSSSSSYSGSYDMGSGSYASGPSSSSSYSGSYDMGSGSYASGPSSSSSDSGSYDMGSGSYASGPSSSSSYSGSYDMGSGSYATSPSSSSSLSGGKRRDGEEDPQSPIFTAYSSPSGNSGVGGAGSGWPAPRSTVFPEMPCYTFNEERGLFVFWGRNSQLRLLSASQMVPGR